MLLCNNLGVGLHGNLHLLMAHLPLILQCFLSIFHGGLPGNSKDLHLDMVNHLKSLVVTRLHLVMVSILDNIMIPKGLQGQGMIHVVITK